MNNELYFDLTYLKVILAWSFCRIQGLGLLFFTNNKLYFDLKISEFSVTSVAKKISKTKPKQSQFKAKQTQFFGGFWRKNFNFSLKIDDTKLNFLCKTKPIYKNLILSMSFQKTLNIPNKANLNKILTYLTNEMKRTYSDFCQKDVKKTKPILTFS